MGKGFLKGIVLSHCMDTVEELHAFLQGWGRILVPFPLRYHPSQELLDEIESEHHYYVVGMVAGMFTWLLIAKLVQVMFF